MNKKNHFTNSIDKFIIKNTRDTDCERLMKKFPSISLDNQILYSLINNINIINYELLEKNELLINNVKKQLSLNNIESIETTH